MKRNIGGGKHENFSVNIRAYFYLAQILAPADTVCCIRVICLCSCSISAEITTKNDVLFEFEGIVVFIVLFLFILLSAPS